MAYRVQYFFTQQAELLAGWSENYWNSNNNLSSVYPQARALRTLLAAFHGAQSVCPNIRYSVVGAFRDVALDKYVVAPNVPGDATIDSDFPEVAALLRLTGQTETQRYKTNQWIKGIEDSCVNQGGRWKPRPGITTAFNAIKAHLTNASNGWCVRVQDRNVPMKAVTAVTNGGVVTVIAHGYTSLDFVRISRGKGTMPVNGLWQIVVVDPDTFSLVGWQSPSPAGVYLGHATSQKQIKTLVPIVDAEIVRATERKVGRPFGQFSGRRRVKRT